VLFLLCLFSTGLSVAGSSRTNPQELINGVTGGYLTSEKRANSDPSQLAKMLTIYRDTYGVPHVFGRTDASSVFGFAYVQAEDNFCLATERVEEIRVETDKGIETRRFTVHRTHHGPVVAERDGKLLTLRMAKFESDGRLREWYEMTKSRSLAEFKRALSPHNMLFGNVPKQFPPYMVQDGDNPRGERPRQILSTTRSFTFQEWRRVAFDTRLLAADQYTLEDIRANQEAAYHPGEETNTPGITRY